MDKSIFDKYIAEMRVMRAAATKAAEREPERVTIKSQPNADNMEGKGLLTVNVTSVRGLYPVKGARVTVFTGDGEDMQVVAEGITDQSGKTPAFELAAPSAVFSESPNPSERPFALYNIRTVEDGFNENLNFNVAVFDGVTSLQNVGLEPIVSAPEQNRPIVIDEFESYEL